LIHIKALPGGRALDCVGRTPRLGRSQMLDLILLATGLGLFALSVGYTIACDRL
jgi:hypothetical protein